MRQVQFRWWTVGAWTSRLGSGRTVPDVERPCSICLLDFDLASMVVVGPDGPGAAYMVCRGCKALHTPESAWKKAHKWVSGLTSGFGADQFQ